MRTVRRTSQTIWWPQHRSYMKRMGTVSTMRVIGAIWACIFAPIKHWRYTVGKWRLPRFRCAQRCQICTKFSVECFVFVSLSVVAFCMPVMGNCTCPSADPYSFREKVFFLTVTLLLIPTGRAGVHDLLLDGLQLWHSLTGLLRHDNSIRHIVLVCVRLCLMLVWIQTHRQFVETILYRSTSQTDDPYK